MTVRDVKNVQASVKIEKYGLTQAGDLKLPVKNL